MLQSPDLRAKNLHQNIRPKYLAFWGASVIEGRRARRARRRITSTVSE